MTGMEMIALAGVALSAAGSIASGMQQNAQAKAQSRAMGIAAKRAEAAGLRKAQEKRREGEYVMSQQQAQAAAGGGAVNDPTVLDLIGDAAGETEIQAKELEAQGSAEATDIRNQAALTRWGGKQDQLSGFVKAGSSIASAGAGLYSKYNPAEPTGGRYGGRSIFGRQRLRATGYG